jgi:hypothetical protein
MESKFTVGAEVVEVTSGFSRNRYGRITKIAKVYKNGNFTLECDQDKSYGRPSQYRPDYSGKSADMCGQSSLIHRSWVVLYDEETKEKIDAERREQARLARAAKLQQQFNTANFRRLTPHQLTELERLFDMYFPKEPLQS